MNLQAPPIGIALVAPMTVPRPVSFVLMTVVAAAAVVALEAPVRAVTFPLTLARDVALGASASGGRVATRLPPTHVAFSWTGAEGDLIRYRTVTDGHVSTWRRVHESHEMATSDRRYSAVFVVDRPDTIEWDVVGTSVTEVILHEINTLDGPRRTREVPAGASALAATPEIVTRAEWGADESVKRTAGGCERRFYEVQQLFVHHTAGRNNDPDPAATMRAIYWFHVNDRGWCDIGYNFVIGPDGSIFEARWARSYGPWETRDSEDRHGLAVSGAHVAGYNSGSVGTSLIGNFQDTPLPPAMRDALVALLAWEVDRHDLVADGSHVYRNPESGLSRRLPYIAGHRDAGETACPGRRVYRALDGIRREIKAIVGPGRITSVLTIASSERRIRYGDSVMVSGTLTDGDGTPLAGRQVTLYKRAGKRPWRTVGRALTTGVAGEFSAEVTPLRNARAIASFSGEETLWESDSNLVRMSVEPRVTLALRDGVQDPSGVYQFESDTVAVRLFGEVQPDHAGRRVHVRVAKRRPDGTYRELVAKQVVLNSVSGYRYRFLLPTRRAGTYRAVTRFVGDEDHVGAWSPRARFVIESE